MKSFKVYTERRNEIQDIQNMGFTSARQYMQFLNGEGQKTFSAYKLGSGSFGSVFHNDRGKYLLKVCHDPYDAYIDYAELCLRKHNDYFPLIFEVERFEDGAVVVMEILTPGNARAAEEAFVNFFVTADRKMKYFDVEPDLPYLPTPVYVAAVQMLHQYLNHQDMHEQDIKYVENLLKVYPKFNQAISLINNNIRNFTWDLSQTANWALNGQHQIVLLDPVWRNWKQRQ